MTIIDVYWDILTSQGRVIKAAVDLAKIHCKFIPQDYNPIQKQTKLNTIYSLDTLKQVFNKQKTNRNIFGSSNQQKLQIQKALTYYNNNFKHLLNFSIFDLTNQQNKQIRIQKIKQKKYLIQQTLKQFNKYLQNINNKFICGNNITIIDLIYYFDICNLAYFGKNPSHYTHIWKWFQNIYSFKEIKIITHQWHAMAKQISIYLKITKPKSKI